jgi:signal transduction histidine kinase
MIIQNFLGMVGVIQSINLAEQRERQRIAQVLHDDIQQLLYAALMQLPLAPSDGAADPSIEGDAADGYHARAPPALGTLAKLEY